MKFRFEVTNGQHEVNEDNMLARTMSYAMMLGDIKEARHVVKTLNLPI